MKIQESLIQRIEGYIKQLQREKDLSEYRFKTHQSNTTKSIYIRVSTKVNGKILRRSFRISDHRNSKIPTKIVCKSTNFTLIKRRVKGLITALEKRRLEESFNAI